MAGVRVAVNVPNVGTPEGAPAPAPIDGWLNPNGPAGIGVVSQGLVLEDQNGTPLGTGTNPISITGGTASAFTPFADELVMTGAGIALPNHPCAEVFLVARSSNLAAILVGTAAGQKFPLGPGQAFPAAIKTQNTNLLYASGQAGDILDMLGSG